MEQVIIELLTIQNQFRITAKTQMLEDKTATITIIGNETGGSVTINLTVKKVTTATTGNV